MQMKELAKKYKEALKPLNKRISELEALKRKLINEFKDPDRDSEIADLNKRLKPLRLLQRDTIEVTKEVEHYFDKGWWRSEKYTLNARHAARRYV